MSSLEEIQQALVDHAFDNERQWFGRDLCDLIGPVLNEGGGAGDTVTLEPLALGVECFVEEISGAGAETVIGGEAFVSSHLIRMKRSPATLAITPQYRVRVHPRGNAPERVFEKPVQTVKSFSPLVMVKASFVVEGFAQ